MTINRQDISSSADGNDIFVISEPATSFINRGSLATGGDVASTIRVAADGVTISNFGNLATNGDGSPAILAGDPLDLHYDNVTILNYGTITTNGSFYDPDGNGEFDVPSGGSPFSDGIDVFGNHARVVNYSSVAVTGTESGIASVGADSTIINYGEIASSGFAGIVLDTVYGGETDNLVLNYGRIHTTGDGSRGISGFTENNTIRNYGSIQADGFNSFGIAMEAAGNHAVNYGTILVTGEIARGVLMLGEGTSFDNYGTVRATGDGGIGVRFSSENAAGTDGGIFTNYGMVEGAGRSVSGTDSDDHVINRGSLTGDVSLGSGDDSYLAGKGGSLDGLLRLGSGNDLINFAKGGGTLAVADFAAGAGSDDVIDVSALGIHSFGELLAHAAQSGPDLVLRFGAKDQIVLHGLDLTQLAADDFGFASSLNSVSHTGHDWLLS